MSSSLIAIKKIFSTFISMYGWTEKEMFSTCSHGDKEAIHYNDF